MSCLTIVLFILLVQSKCYNIINYKVTGRLFCNTVPLSNAAFLLWKDNIYMVDDFIGKGISERNGFFEAQGLSKFPRLHDIYFQIVDKCQIIEENCYNVRRGYLKPLRNNKTTHEYIWNLGNIDILSDNITNFKVSLIKVQCYDNTGK